MIFTPVLSLSNFSYVDYSVSAFQWRMVFRPNAVVDGRIYRVILLFELIAGIALWTLAPSVIPSPMRVWAELTHLVMQEGLMTELWASLTLNVEAIAISTVISLLISYGSAFPIFHPIARAVAKARFASLMGMVFVVTVFLGGGHILKLVLLTIGMTVFFVTSMVDVIEQTSQSELEYARSLRMSEWRVLWEIRILGTVDAALDILRQNAAMGWLMLTMVEGLARSEGGLGKMLLDQDKHFSLAAILAIQVVFLLIGLTQDTLLRWLKDIVAPYAALTVAKR